MNLDLLKEYQRGYSEGFNAVIMESDSLKLIEVSDEELLVAQVKTVRTGSIFNISPSYGYPDIPKGHIEVIDLVKDVPYEEMSEEMQAWVDAVCPEGTYEPGRTYEPEIQEELNRLFSEYWVISEYINTNEIVSLPIREFLGHTSIA